MPIEITGRFRGPKNLIRRAIARSVTFQELCGVTGNPDPEASALAFVHSSIVSDAQRPHFIVTNPEITGSGTGGGNATHLSRIGSASAFFEMDVPENLKGEVNYKEADDLFIVKFGLIVDEIEAQSGVDDNLDYRLTRSGGDIQRSDEDARSTDGDFFYGIIEFVWGVTE